MQRNKKSAVSQSWEWHTHTYIKTRMNYDGSRISSASHTVPNEGRRKAHQLQSNTRGKSSLDHQKNAKKAGVDQLAFGRILCADACFDAAVGVRVRTCSARRPPGRFSPFPPPALCSSLYAAGRMSTWSCQTWTRAQERARGRKESAIFWCDFAQWHGEAARRCELLYI